MMPLVWIWRRRLLAKASHRDVQYPQMENSCQQAEWMENLDRNLLPFPFSLSLPIVLKNSPFAWHRAEGWSLLTLATCTYGKCDHRWVHGPSHTNSLTRVTFRVQLELLMRSVIRSSETHERNSRWGGGRGNNTWINNTVQLSAISESFCCIVWPLITPVLFERITSLDDVIQT